MDAGGLAKPDDLLTPEECSLLPIDAMRRQLEMREACSGSRAQSLEFRYATVQLRNLIALAELKAMSCHGGVIKLQLGKASFSLLVDGDTIGTCYTDGKDKHTSRSDSVSALALLEFARSVIALLDPEVDIKAV